MILTFAEGFRFFLHMTVYANHCCPLSRNVLMIVSGVVPWHRGLSMRQTAVHMCEDQDYIFQLALYGILTSSSRGPLSIKSYFCFKNLMLMPFRMAEM